MRMRTKPASDGNKLLVVLESRIVHIVFMRSRRESGTEGVLSGTRTTTGEA